MSEEAQKDASNTDASSTEVVAAPSAEGTDSRFDVSTNVSQIQLTQVTHYTSDLTLN